MRLRKTFEFPKGEHKKPIVKLGTWRRSLDGGMLILYFVALPGDTYVPV